MVDQFIENCQVINNSKVAPKTYRMELIAPQICHIARPGQFVMVETNKGYDPLLRRPLSIHNVKDSTLFLLYKRVGKGTNELSQIKPGDDLSILGPNGHGFEIANLQKHGLVGGGVGVAPLLHLASKIRKERINDKITVFIGGQNKYDLLAIKELELVVDQIEISTDDGSAGYHGFVTDIVARLTGQWAIYTCGPQPMMEIVAKIAKGEKWPCQVSLEAHMACGMGACLGCAVKTKDLTGKMVHVCKNGPVFEANEIWL